MINTKTKKEIELLKKNTLPRKLIKIHYSINKGKKIVYCIRSSWKWL